MLNSTPKLRRLFESLSIAVRDMLERAGHKAAFSTAMLKRKSVLLRNDRACQLLLRFARDNECTGFFVTKDLARVLPDGHISMAHRTILLKL